MKPRFAPGDSPRVFVGTEAYKAAGGIILRDLFENDRGGWFQDADLLNRLVEEKLAAEAERFRAEGWKWVEAVVDFPTPTSAASGRSSPSRQH